ncbi:MAG: zinc-binding dehydrogenase [Elusimicrobia bacterium]|nr:zinc-binding dehydrogenase [Candidatus Liberimonas magnetica]
MKTKAAVLNELNKPLVIEELIIPELKEGQVLVKIKASGLCHSQLNEIKGNKGPDKFLPHTMGHEGAGIVEEIGRNIKKVKKGDHVVLTWIKGSGFDVPSAIYVTSDGIKVNSGAISTFTEYAVVSENRLVKIPEEVPFKDASLLGCAIPTGAGIIKNTVKLQPNHSLAVFGVGGIGSSAVLYAASIGCSKIIAIDINDSKLEFAKRIGAKYTLNSKKEDVISKIKKFSDGKGVDYSVECSGVKEVMEMAFNSINNKGTTVIAGNLKHGERISINPFDLIVGKKIIGTWGGETYPDVDIPVYIELYLSKKLKLNELITNTYDLQNINTAFADLEQGKVQRAVIVFNKE